MATFAVGADTAYALDEGIYDAELATIEDAVRDPNKPSIYGDKAQFIFTYQLLDESGHELAWDDGTPATKKEWINKVGALTPKSTLYGRFSALLNSGQPLDPEKEYDTNDLLHQRCQVVWGGYVGDDGSRKHKIKDVLPPKRRAAAGGLRRKPAEDEPIDPDNI